MLINLKSGAVFATLWAATVVAAYLIGSGDSPGGRSPGAPRRAAVEPGTLPAAPGASSHAGARPLSPSSPVASGARGMGGDAAERLLHLLSGASGADLDRSDFRALAETLSLAQVEEIIGEIAAMPPGPAQRDAHLEVLARWAQLDASAALDHAGAIGAPKLRYDATTQVLRHWAAVDPAAAVAFVDSDLNTDLPQGAMGTVFRSIGSAMDTTAALDFLANIEHEQHQKYAYESVRELFERNDTEVIEWTQSLPQGALRDRSIQALMDQWARYDPIAAKAWLADNTSESNRAGALVELGESWARIDPEAATAWARESIGDAGDAGVSKKVIDRVFRRWLEYDFASAAGYLVEQDPSPELDGALEQYIRQIKDVDPDATMAWAESISDPKRRRNAVFQVAKVLKSQDKPAFESYVESSPVFTEAERDKLLGRKKEVPQPQPKTKTKQGKQEKKRAMKVEGLSR